MQWEKLWKGRLSDSIAELSYVHNQWYRRVAKFIMNIAVVMLLTELAFICTTDTDGELSL